MKYVIISFSIFMFLKDLQRKKIFKLMIDKDENATIGVLLKIFVAMKCTLDDIVEIILNEE